MMTCFTIIFYYISIINSLNSIMYPTNIFVLEIESRRNEDCTIERQHAPFNMAYNFKNLSQSKKNINGDLPSIIQRPSSSGKISDFFVESS